MVYRDGKHVTLRPARPEQIDGAYRLGFVLRGEKLGIAASAWQSLKLTGIVTREIGNRSAGSSTARAERTSRARSASRRRWRESSQQGVQDYLWVLGLISLSLALMNMLPLLPLDGGHIAFSIVEGIRGRAVAREVYERVSVVGIALVLFLFVIGISNDVGRLGGGYRRLVDSSEEWPAPGRSRSAASRSAAARPSSSSR